MNFNVNIIFSGSTPGNKNISFINQFLNNRSYRYSYNFCVTVIECGSCIFCNAYVYRVRYTWNYKSTGWTNQFWHFCVHDFVNFYYTMTETLEAQLETLTNENAFLQKYFSLRKKCEQLQQVYCTALSDPTIPFFMFFGSHFCWWWSYKLVISIQVKLPSFILIK